MTLNKLLTELNNFLPSYEIRTFVFFFLVVVIILSLCFFLFKKKLKKNIFIILYAIYISAYIAVPMVLTIMYLKNLNSLLTKEYLPLLITYAIVFILEISFLLLFLFKKKLSKIIYILKVILLSLATLLLLTISLFHEPKVLAQGMDSKGILEESSSIQVSFNIPVNKNNLKIHISPESDVNIEYDKFLNLEGWVKGYTIKPKESFLPDQKIVVYTTGISRIFPYGKQHENSQEFFTPSTPEVEGFVLGADINNVALNQPIVFELSSKDQNFVEWEVSFLPEVEYEILRDESENVSIKPKDLKQGTEYKLILYRNIIRYDTETKETLSQESHELIKEVVFRTIPAPGIKGFNRDGVIMSNTEPLIVTFETPLEGSTLEGRTSIAPAIEGTLSLSEDFTQIIFKPSSAFAKDTEYTFTIKQGLNNKLGGYIEQDVNIVFRTPGTVQRAGSSPWNGQKDVSNTLSTISVTFNQPVNKDTVQQNWTMSPNVDGTFSWKGNTVYYTLSSPLQWGTKYTISISAGIQSIYGINSQSVISTSFTTKSETVLLNVPQYFQSETFTCNLAATKMILAYKGISSSESGIRDSIGIGQNPQSSWVNLYGVHAGPISSYISSRGVSNSVKTGWNLTSALNEVKAGHPVILWVYNGYSQPYGPFTLEGGFTGYKGMHSEVIVGFVGKPEAPESIILNDPWRGRRSLTPSTLMGKWAYLGYTAIVIY